VASGSEGGSRTDPVDGDFAPGISRWRQIRGLGALYVKVTALPNFRLARHPARIGRLTDVGFLPIHREPWGQLFRLSRIMPIAPPVPAWRRP
jgi:hypothetical protein